MIDELRIAHLGVIKEAELRLGGGMTAITGETGAGKTMALTSLSLLMGAKADTTLVRDGAQRATVEGTFVVEKDSPVVSIVENAGGTVDIEGNKAFVIIARHIPASGRSRAYVGGQSVPIAVLHNMAEHLVTVHGQADQLKLRSESQQRAALDVFGGADVAQPRATYDEAWAKLGEAEKAVEDFRVQAREAASERLALEAFISRVDAVAPLPDEEGNLRSRALVLENVEDLRSAMAGAVNALSGDEDDAGALLAIDSASDALAQMSQADVELEPLAQQLKDASLIASDVANQLGMKLSQLDADPEELNNIHARRAELRTLQRDLGMTIEEILTLRQSADVKLQSLASPEEHLAALDDEVARLRRRISDAGTALRGARREAGDILGVLVTKELHSLAMKDATFSVDLQPYDEPTRHGLDRVAFLLSPYRGAPSLPLTTSASGGEVSRVMLALETSLNSHPRPDHTFIFDEVDAGIGGKTALSVGERLARVAKNSQVITVTHLAQVAAYADEHVIVAKQNEGGTTSTNVLAIAGEDRISELARMLSGHSQSDAARAHAAELLESAVVP